MARSSDQIDVYLIFGKKLTFAGAVDWPGWCRGGRASENPEERTGKEGSALQALFDYGPRYTEVLRGTQLGFRAPADVSIFSVVERLEGTASTDFGVPDVATSNDTRPVDNTELQRFQVLLKACWRAFDAAAMAAADKELRKGPRGGGRELDGIIRHVLGADEGYLSRLAWKLEPSEGADLSVELDRTRQAILDALAAAARGEVAPSGPRGGVRWTPRYFVRRVAWHVLDHAWEIEDRMI